MGNETTMGYEEWIFNDDENDREDNNQQETTQESKYLMVDSFHLLFQRYECY